MDGHNTSQKGGYSERNRRRRIRTAKSQGWKCPYCGVRMSAEEADCVMGVQQPYFGTWEHLKARLYGGGKSDRVVACRACNRMRGSKCLPLFLAEHPMIGLYSMIGHPWVDLRIREGFIPNEDRYHTLAVS